ncbi:Ig-like domain-containing protein, partial [Altererythrobacter sp. C41]|uniref:Ig-like domain-containing protein n=1 Tax=Altererythrobacter sp. C41 TaxID=2806021 RepID=UPI001932A99F
ITVTGTNDAPAAVADSYTVDEDNTLTIAAAAGVLANDSDPDGDALSAIVVAGPANGTLTLSPDGSFVYTPDANYTGPDSFTYRANDGTTDSAAVTVDITVTSANDAPMAVADTAAATEDAAAVTGTVATNDSDVDGDTLSYALDAAVAGLTLNADGSYSFDPSDAAYQDLGAGETRDVVASYTVSDGNGGTASSTLTITVTGTNDAPVAVADVAAATEDAAAVTGTVAGNDSDADGDTLAFALVAPVAGLTLNADGSYSFDPSDAAYQDLAAGETRDVVASYTVSDGNGGTASSTLTITVTGTNDTPVAVADVAAATEDAAAVTGTVATNDSDVDGDTLNYALDAAVPGLTLNADGSYSFDPSDAAYQDLAAGETRDVVASYTVSDGNGGTASSTLTITVTGTNDAPIAVADTDAATEDAAPVTGTVAGNDSDADGDTLSYTLDAAVAGLTFNADGS